MMKHLFLIVLISISFHVDSQNTSNQAGIIADKRVNKVREYHENGQLKVKGKEIGKEESLGCLGRMKVYKKNGRWKYYNSQGYLMKIVKYKDDKDIKIIKVINKR